MLKNPVRIVFCTCPPTLDVQQLARTLVEQKLAACVNILHNISSVYTWKDTLCEENEILLIIKTTEKAYPTLESWIREHHPYEVPEILALPVVAGFEPYVRWIGDNVGSRSQGEGR